jgi:hypothetical protein
MKRTVQENVKWLRKEGEEWGLPPRGVEFYIRLFQIQAEMEQRIGAVKPALDKKGAEDRIQSGVPLLKPGELRLDGSLLKEAFSRTLEAFVDFGDLFGNHFGGKKRDESHSALKRLIGEFLDGMGSPRASALEDTPDDLLAKAVLCAALKPFWVVHSRALLGLFDPRRWRIGTCPVCGGRADFAFLDRERGSRWLVCCCCDAQWLFQRLQCPYCDNQNEDSLSYFTDEKEIYRLYVCERCGTYLKAADWRHLDRDLFLPLERLLTLSLDSQAREKGYKPGTLDGPWYGHPDLQALGLQVQPFLGDL